MAKSGRFAGGTLDGYIADYITALRARGLSAHTVRWYHQGLRQFAGWLSARAEPEDPQAWTPALMRAYIIETRERTTPRAKPLSRHQASNLVSTVKGFCQWLVDEGILRQTPFLRVAVPKRPRLVKPVLSPEELPAVISAARAGRTGVRDEAILLFLLDTGVRASELCSLRPEQIDWDQRIARVYGKGAKERYVPFSEITAAAMRRYARKRPDGQTFFLARGGKPFTVSGLEQALRRIGRRAGGKAGPLGVFSGIATTCCAPVLAGVIALSGAASSFGIALGLGLAYVFGMVAPLFVISLVWDRRDWRTSRLFTHRSFTWRFGRIRRTISMANLASSSGRADVPAVLGPDQGHRGGLGQVSTARHRPHGHHHDRSA